MPKIKETLRLVNVGAGEFDYVFNSDKPGSINQGCIESWVAGEITENLGGFKLNIEEPTNSDYTFTVKHKSDPTFFMRLSANTPADIVIKIVIADMININKRILRKSSKHL